MAAKWARILVAERLADGRLDERPGAGTLQNPVAGPCGPRLVAHDVARMDARVDPALVLRVVGQGKLDRIPRRAGPAPSRGASTACRARPPRRAALSVSKAAAVRATTTAPLVSVSSRWMMPGSRAECPMNASGPYGNELREAPEHRVDQRADLARTDRRRGLAGGLVDDDDLRRLEDDSQRRVGAAGRGHVGDLRDVDAHRVPLGEGAPLGHPTAVDANGAQLDRALHPGPAELWQELRDPLVEPGSVKRRGHDKGAHRVRGVSRRRGFGFVHRSGDHCYHAHPTFAADGRALRAGWSNPGARLAESGQGPCSMKRFHQSFRPRGCNRARCSASCFDDSTCRRRACHARADVPARRSGRKPDEPHEDCRAGRRPVRGVRRPARARALRERARPAAGPSPGAERAAVEPRLPARGHAGRAGAVRRVAVGRAQLPHARRRARAHAGGHRLPGHRPRRGREHRGLAARLRRARAGEARARPGHDAPLLPHAPRGHRLPRGRRDDHPRPSPREDDAPVDLPGRLRPLRGDARRQALLRRPRQRGARAGSEAWGRAGAAPCARPSNRH